MAVFRFDKRFGDLRKYPNRNLIESVVYYIIDSKYRKSVNLVSWLAEQVELARNTPEIVEQALRLKKTDDDLTMQAVFNYVRTAKFWRSDWDNWQRLEYWENVTDVFKNQSCDCESGSLLIYCMARICDVPADALYMWCGDVFDPRINDRFGHAVCLYKPIEYPINYVMMDWCYYMDGKSISARNKFTMYGQLLWEYQKNGDVYDKLNSNYLNTWFAINEKKSFRWFR